MCLCTLKSNDLRQSQSPAAHLEQTSPQQKGHRRHRIVCSAHTFKTAATDVHKTQKPSVPNRTGNQLRPGQDKSLHALLDPARRFYRHGCFRNEVKTSRAGFLPLLSGKFPLHSGEKLGVSKPTCLLSAKRRQKLCLDRIAESSNPICLCSRKMNLELVVCGRSILVTSWSTPLALQRGYHLAKC